MACDVLITGAGSVTEATCRALALAANKPLSVTILGRDEDWVRDLAGLASGMAAELGHLVGFHGEAINWDAPDELPERLSRHQPRAVFHTASLQSPWELLGDVRDTPWRQLVWAAGNAITLPLQVVLAKRVAAAVQEMDQPPLVVNVCFPDWVNPLLRHMGLPITCGTGNVAMFTGFLKARYPEPQHTVQVVGHLYHYFKIMGRPHTSVDGPRVWIDGAEVPNVEATLADCFQRLRSVNSRGKIINGLVGVASAEALLGLLDTRQVRTHVPGPNGLPGGYPVRLGDGQVELDLPPGISEAEAGALNRQGAYDMGAAIIDEQGYTAFSETAAEALAQYAPELAAGFHIKDLDEVSKRFVELRTRLGGSP